MRNESLAHFSGLGYRTIGASYYDADDLEDQELLTFSLDEMAAALLNGEVRVTSWYASFSNALLWLRKEREEPPKTHPA